MFLKINMLILELYLPMANDSNIMRYLNVAVTHRTIFKFMATKILDAPLGDLREFFCGFGPWCEKVTTQVTKSYWWPVTQGFIFQVSQNFSRSRRPF